MAFESTTNVNAVVNENGEAVAVKVSYGGEMRRATCHARTYLALRDLCAHLFELDVAATVLKYQDSDGDKITVSSDGELQEALKETKILRLFVELKVAPAAEEEQPAFPFPCGGWRRFGGPMRGGFPCRGGFARGGFPRGGFGGHHAFPHGPHGPHPHPFPGHNGPHGFPGHFGGFAPAATPNANEQGPCANFSVPRTFGHGVFSPADAPHHAPFSPYARCGQFKEHKRAMKEHIKMMKANAVTEEDRKAIKEFKEQMRAECKARWHDMKHDLKHDMKHEKKAYKAEKKADKAQWKEKRDLVARHVADVTVPDNSELPSDTPVTKTWRLRNAGLQAWPADSQLIFVSRRGDNLNGPERVFVGAVEPQQEVDVSVTFITPSEPGRYIGYYRMATGDGTKFGQRVWVSFIIPVAMTMPVPVPMPASREAPTAPLLYPVVHHSPSAHAHAHTAQGPATNDISMD